MRFRSSPFYPYYTGQLQLEADNALIAVCDKLNTEDPYAVQHREQLIGAAPAFLKFTQICDDDLLILQEKVTSQNNE